MGKTNLTTNEVLRSPLFIIGAERSGTTWLQRLLLAEQGFVGGQESQFCTFSPSPSTMRAMRDAERSTGPCHYLSEQDLVAHAHNLWDSMFLKVVQSQQSARVLVEKSPMHSLHVEDLGELFPKSKFVHIIRDGRAVALSMIRAHKDGWGRKWAPRSFRHACKKWQAYYRGATAGKDLQDRYIEVRYESLCKSPEEVLARVKRFAMHEKPEQQGGVADKAVGFGLDREEPLGFSRQPSPEQWRSEISFAQRVTARLTIGKTLSELGYGQW